MIRYAVVVRSRDTGVALGEEEASGETPEDALRAARALTATYRQYFPFCDVRFVRKEEA